ncbi:unannotated protein [freshwater metagenome]|uniref:Unannotated protein n=1 Tax=freshwater metagenome TaxID=449393 RepID=A0A6J7HZK9_9ZZZZ
MSAAKSVFIDDSPNLLGLKAKRPYLVSNLGLLESVDHRPFVESEAAESGRTLRGSAQ